MERLFLRYEGFTLNKSFLEHYMKTKPETTEQKYLFLVDNLDIAYALIYTGYPAIFL